MEIKIDDIKKLIENKGFKLQKIGKIKRSKNDFVEDVVALFMKDNYAIEIRTYTLELVIRFKNIKIDHDYIDIYSMMYYFELMEGFIAKKNFFERFFSQQVARSSIVELNYFFLKKKLDDILTMLNDENFKSTVNILNNPKNELTEKEFSKMYFLSKTNFNKLLDKYL